MFPVWSSLCAWPLLTGDTRGTAFRDMTDGTEAKVGLAHWAEVGRRWHQIPKEERVALHPSLTLPIKAEMQAYQERRARKNKAAEAAKMGLAESEAWAEQADRERREKLARAIAKIRRAKP